MSDFAEISTPTRSGTISIRPYVDKTVPNMGLENYGLVLFDGATHSEQLTCLVENGVERYLTGLNEFAPEIRKMKDEKKREAIVKEIRKKVSFLEEHYNSNSVPVDDPQFWDKIEVIHPKNFTFWSKVFLTTSNDPQFLDPEKPDDLIKICAIEAGGFPAVAKSLEDARSRSIPVKWYLDRYEESASTKVELKKLKNKALSTLEELSEKSDKKLFYICKVIDGNPSQYKLKTPAAVLYDNMDKFISGEGVEASPKRAAEAFLDAAKASMQDLKLKAIIRDAVFFKIITLRGDGLFYHQTTNTMLGRNTEEILEYMKNPINDKILDPIQNAVEANWK